MTDTTEEQRDQMTCVRCGCDVFQAAERGAYLKRVSPKGESFRGECVPSCEHKSGGPDEALIGAIEDN